MKKLLCLIAILFTSTAFAVSTMYWQNSTYNDFADGELKNVGISSKGFIAPTYEAKKIEMEVDNVWSTIKNENNVLYIGTGKPAKIYRLEKDKPVEIFASKDDISITDFCRIGNAIYAASIPNGKIYKILNNKVTEYVELDAPYIWALEADKKGNLFAGTGPDAKLYRISKTKKIELLYDADDAHIFSMAMDKKGELVFGSSSNAFLYKLRKNNKVEVLYDFIETEISAIEIFKDKIFVGVNKYASQGFDVNFDELTNEQSKHPQVEKKDEIKTTMPVFFAEPEYFAVYEVKENYGPKPLIKINGESINDIKIGKDKNLFLATGGKGRIYAIELADDNYFMLADLDDMYVTTMVLVKGVPAFVGTGSIGNIYKVKRATLGVYTSNVFDSEFLSEWGRVIFEKDGQVWIKTRTGNTGYPDKTWNDWSGKLTQTSSKIVSKNSRYFQYRAGFTDKNSKLNRIKISFLNENQPPYIFSINVSKASASKDSKEGQQTSISESAIMSTNKGVKIVKTSRKNSDFDSESSLIRIEWNAVDPDEDKLVYDLFYKGEKEKTWKQVPRFENVAITKYVWDTASIPNGMYVMGLKAKDIKSNPEERALSDFSFSEPFLVDNSLPIVSTLRYSNGKVKGEAFDDFSIIKRIDYSVDGNEYKLVFPLDKIFDQKKEGFSFNIKEELSKGEHSVSVRAFDTNSNVGIGKVVFVVK